MSISQNEEFPDEKKSIPVPLFLRSILDAKELDISIYNDFMLGFALNKNMIDYLSDLFNVKISYKFFSEDEHGVGQFVINQDCRSGVVQPNPEYSQDEDEITVELTRGDIVNILYKVQDQDLVPYDIYKKIQFSKNRNEYISVPPFLRSTLVPSTIIINDYEHEGFMMGFELNEYIIDYLSNFFNITIPKEYFGEDPFGYSGQFVIEQDWTKGLIQRNSNSNVDNIEVKLTRGDIVNILYELKDKNFELYDIYNDQIEFKTDLD